jgi:hypothetical protein
LSELQHGDGRAVGQQVAALTGVMEIAGRAIVKGNRR